MMMALWAASAAQGAQELPGRVKLEDTVSVTCFTAPYRDVALASEIGGVVTQVLVEEGDAVRKGQPLVRLNDDVYRAQLAISKAQVEKAKHSVEAAKVEYETRLRDYNRAADLFKKQVVSSEEFDEAKRKMLVSKIGLDNALAQQKQAELTVKRDEVLLKQTVITAPFDGIVYRIVKREGAAVERERDVLMHMASIDPLYVIAYVPIQTVGHIRVGDRAGLVLEHMPKAPLVCTVAVVDKVADAASGTYRVKLLLRNPRQSLPAGAKGSVTFRLTKKQRGR